jgi:hypothetical protein
MERMTIKPPPSHGYQRTLRVPGPFEREEPPLRYRFIALPIIGTLAWLLLTMGGVS